MRGRDLVAAVTMTSIFVVMFWVQVVIVTRPCAAMSNPHDAIRGNVPNIVEIGAQAIPALRR
jgi:hypothetical protein